ncbi:beta-lactamase family protein [Streptomyces sp. ISL-43]|nr:beta-lactamase family protein [Streptomyces sp. ISL-43]
MATALQGVPAAAAVTAPAALERCAATSGPVGGEAREILELARRAKSELALKSVILRVTRDGREVVTGALGESMSGVPVTADMHFRSGSVAIAYMATVLLQLVEEGKAGLDDPVARWLPDLRDNDKITLRMLGSTTSGLHDYVSDPKFIADFYAAPFRHWTPGDLLSYPLAHPLWYEPGTNWSYSHINFVLLGAALEKISGTPLDKLLQQRVMGPLGLQDTANGFTPQIPAPVLHSYDAERGKYEESTYWDPSWSTAPGAVQTTHICDLARSAQAIGSGELLSPASFKTQLDPGTVGLGHSTKDCPATVCSAQVEDRHFGFGLIVSKGWVLQNPSLTGFAAIQAYLPAERLAIAVTATVEPGAPEGNAAQNIAERLAVALTPDHPLK